MNKKQASGSNGKNTAPEIETHHLRINFTYPHGTASSFSNYMTCQSRPEGIFHLSFFEIAHPLLVGDQEAIRQQAQALESVDAPCVARLIVSAEQMKKMIAALAESYDSYEQSSRTVPESQRGKRGKKNAS